MIKFVTGNIFESGADCLVNTVNCEGFMGKGIAYQFKMRFPQNNLDYVKACKSGMLHIGAIHYYKEDEIWSLFLSYRNYIKKIKGISRLL
ncbi:MAG: macro domain-containing protein [Acetivibrio sp.]